MGKLSGLISSGYGFTVEAATALSHPSSTQSAPHTSKYGYYSRSHNALLYQQPNEHLSSRERRELPLPVIIPQRRPQDKSRGWVRAYAPALMGAGIDEVTFLDFIDRFNEESKASPYFHVVNVAGAGVGFLPGITPMIVSMAVPVAVQVAKQAQSNHQTQSYLDKMNTKLFVPHGLYAIIMTYKPQQTGDMLNVDVSSNGSQFPSPYPRLFPKAPSGRNSYQKQDFTLPDSCPLVFADSAPPQTLDPSRNGFFKMADFVSDFKDRRAQTTFAQENPASTLVGPKPTFTSKYADPSYLSNAKDDMRKTPKREKEKKKPGTLKSIKEKVMHSDVLHLMIVNNPTDSTTHLRMASPGPAYQHGTPPRTNNSWYEQQYSSTVEYSHSRQQAHNPSLHGNPPLDNPQMQATSTYQYGPSPLQISTSDPQPLYQQQLPAAKEEYDPKQNYSGPVNYDKGYEHVIGNENRQVSGNGEHFGQQHQARRETQSVTPSPVPRIEVPPIYTPYPRDE
ncbi:hypothetical protein ONS95_004647 [Cadophora gregata]|uniref:uncharacterized protein n=1 Tax=Cadophora gregata TaxID=51156 RepID=UPI0026DC5DA9|nr:uncharacterized protein ONS95_004647 [Cadophora gregata]KAK0104983.1 hypothetical protein ONS96_004391 [Cadophora gregata f. sp. sojae]KAK0106145.1 hypothetical protein ONS95_004647 [Cadophora gregata]